MKKFLFSICLFALVLVICNSAKAMTYDEALRASKPIAILVTAPWADDSEKIAQVFNDKGKEFAKNYNFVTLDIATKDAKSFNQKYTIYPNLPYVLLFRDKGKISRFIKKDCVFENSCFNDKLRYFIN